MDGRFRTKAEPQIYYALVKPLEEDTSEMEQQKEQVRCSLGMNCFENAWFRILKCDW